MPQRGKAYADAGVNLDAANTLVDRIKKIVGDTHTKGVISDIGGFGGLFRPDLNHMREPVLVASTDGVGTKLKLATQFNKHDGIGHDLVGMSVNDILVQGALPLFFLDYFATGKLEPEQAECVIASIASGCTEAGCALLGGETAEMPGMYNDGEYDLAGFCVGMVDNDKIIDGSGTRPGDAIIGLASNGLHSNGYSLVRKICAEQGVTADTMLPTGFSEGDGEKTAAEVLLAPTRIYTKIVQVILRDLPVKGMVHITGGGFYDNIPRVLPNGVQANLEFGSWEMDRVFHWLKEKGDLTWPEMLQIFNCGIGYVFIVDDEQAREVLGRLNRALKIPSWKIGTIGLHEDKESEQVTVRFPA